MHHLLDSPDFETITAKIGEDGFCVIDHFLDKPTIIALAEEAQVLMETSAMKEAGTGRSQITQNKTIRGDHIYWLDENKASLVQQRYFAHMEALRLNLNRDLYLGLFALECHLAVYPPGSFYKKHLDCFANSTPDKPLRRISCIVYLNEDWQTSDGGQLRLYLNQESTHDSSAYLDILPIAGRAVMFLSEIFYHEVLPSSRQRKSLTGWLLTR